MTYHGAGLVYCSYCHYDAIFHFYNIVLNKRFLIQLCRSLWYPRSRSLWCPPLWWQPTYLMDTGGINATHFIIAPVAAGPRNVLTNYNIRVSFYQPTSSQYPPWQAHLPVASRVYGMSCQGELYSPMELVKDLVPLDLNVGGNGGNGGMGMPVCFIIGAMAF